MPHHAIMLRRLINSGEIKMLRRRAGAWPGRDGRLVAPAARRAADRFGR
jgi:hypothetical protein